MNKTKLISLITLGLVVLNIVLVVFILFHKTEPPRHLGPRNIIIERLEFDEKQIRQYDVLINRHRAAIREKETRLLEIKKELYQTLTEPRQPESKDSLISEIGQIQKEIETIHYRHFQDIQHLCKPNQQAAFNQLVNEIADLFFHRMPPHKPL